MKAEFKSISVKDVVHSPNNPRRQPTAKDPEVIELAQSIKAVGLIQPISVRAVKGGKYEIIAGARRFEGVKLAGLPEIPAMVHELDDHAAMKITVTENLQRQDLTPFEEAAGVQSLLDAGQTAAEISAEIGKSTQWVTRRARLTQLIPAARKVMEELGSTIGQMLAMASLPESVQQDIMQERADDTWLFEPQRTESFERYLEERQHMVKSAPFPTDTCKECFKRTGANPDLFGDDAEPAKDDRCLDAECWKQKVQDDMNVKLIQAQKKYPTIAMVRCGYSPDANIAKLPEAGPNDWNDRMIVKKETPGAAPVFVVHGKSAGKVLWVKGGKKEEQASRATGVDGKPVPAKPHEKQQKLHNKRCAWMVAKFDTDEVKCALAELYAASDSVKQLNILLAFGSFVKRAWRSDEAWNLYSTCELGGPELRIAFLEHLAPVFVNRLSFQTLDTAEDAFVEAARICRMLGYPIFAKHYAECMAEIPKPKSFGAEVPDPWADLADPFDPKYEQPRKLSDVTKARSKKA